MKTFSFFLVAAVALISVSGLFADNEARSRKASVVPKGDASVGLSTFIDRGCYKCHLAGKVKLPKPQVAAKLSVQLAGDEHLSWTRDQFARAIMNPNHTIAPEYHIAKIVSGDKLAAENSEMMDFNDILTLKELINLTTFLESLKH